jgi:hypothetical protein
LTQALTGKPLRAALGDTPGVAEAGGREVAEQPTQPTSATRHRRVDNARYRYPLETVILVAGPLWVRRA